MGTPQALSPEKARLLQAEIDRRQSEGQMALPPNKSGNDYVLILCDRAGLPLVLAESIILWGSRDVGPTVEYSHWGPRFYVELAMGMSALVSLRDSPYPLRTKTAVRVLRIYLFGSNEKKRAMESAFAFGGADNVARFVLKPRA